MPTRRNEPTFRIGGFCEFFLFLSDPGPFFRKRSTAFDTALNAFQVAVFVPALHAPAHNTRMEDVFIIGHF
jgi:hypothetical protein